MEETNSQEDFEKEFWQTRNRYKDKAPPAAYFNLCEQAVVMVEKFLAENKETLKPSLYGSNDALTEYIDQEILYNVIPHEYNERYQDLVWSINEDSLWFLTRPPFSNFFPFYYIFGESFDPQTFDPKKLTPKEQRILKKFDEVLTDVLGETVYQFLAGYLLAKGFNIHGHYNSGRTIKEDLEC
jgi:hypothetical protein